MRHALVALAVLLSASAHAEPGCAETHPRWSTDFPEFMHMMDCAAAELAAAPERAGYLERFAAGLSGTTVQWTGTVRHTRGERLYFNESYARVAPDTRASRVMYYAAPDAITDWERISTGQQLAYTGRLHRVKVDSLAAATPLLYVELREVVPNGNRPPSAAVGAAPATEPESR
jgi:hypothetical protein